MKIVNIVLAIGTAIILGALINLGIAAFYPAPQYPNPVPYPASPAVLPCPSADTQCFTENSSTEAQYQAQMDAYNAQVQAADDAMNVYNTNVFIIANVLGIIIFLVGFLVVLYAALASQGVPIGIMIAGLWSIIYGYGRGWGSVDDQLKFFIGLVIALIVIGGSMWLMQKHAQKQSLKRPAKK
jgi:heme/copper-type cytochrome/quinol oxidase subunit 4